MQTPGSTPKLPKENQASDAQDRTRGTPHAAFFLPHLDAGGAEHMIALLSGAISKAGCRTDLILGQARGSYLSIIPEAVNVIDLGAPHEYACLIPLIRYLKTAKPDVILSSLTLATLVMLFSQRIARVKTRTVVRVANTISLQPRSRLKKVVERLLVNLVYRWSGQIVAVSNNVKKDLVDYYQLPPDLIRVIYNPAIPHELEAKTQQPVDHPWFQQTEIPVLLGVGRLVPAKDFKTLIRAFSLVRLVRPVHLAILGKGQEQENLQAYYR